MASRKAKNKVFPLPQVLNQLLNQLKSKDGYGFFLELVSKEQVPDYYDHIKNPMAFSVMKEKLDKGQYTTLDQFKDDFRLIIDNCTYFNDKSTIYHKEAIRLKKVGDRLIAAAADTIDPETEGSGAKSSEADRAAKKAEKAAEKAKPRSASTQLPISSATPLQSDRPQTPQPHVKKETSHHATPIRPGPGSAHPLGTGGEREVMWGETDHGAQTVLESDRNQQKKKRKYVKSGKYVKNEKKAGKDGHRHGDLAPLPDDFAGFPSGRGTIADTLCVWNRDRELKLATGKEVGDLTQADASYAQFWPVHPTYPDTTRFHGQMENRFTAGLGDSVRSRVARKMEMIHSNPHFLLYGGGT